MVASDTTAELDDLPEDPEGIPRVGEQVGHFTVIDTIGRGGMGVVLLGYDARLHRRVAIKLITPRLMADKHTRARFLREARAIALVSHPNIVHVYEVGTHGPHLYMVMEYVEGKPLSNLLAEGPLPWREAVRILSAAGRGLVAAHAAGVVHRDFKPANVLVGDDGRVRVADFGIAQTQGQEEPKADNDIQHSVDRLALEADLTGNAALGTGPYMAPEQHRRQQIDERVDQYAFCVSLFETICGRLPFGRGTAAELLTRKDAGPPEPPGGVAVPRAVRQVLRRGLQPRRVDRFPDMTALLSALRAQPGQRWALGIGAAALVSAAVGLGMPDPAPACEAAGDLAGVWDEAARGRIRSAFEGLDVGHAPGTALRVEAQLDRYAAAWSAMARESCEATHVQHRQSEHVLDLRMQCLERHEDAVRATVEMLAKADRVVAKNAAELVAELPSNAACGEVERLRQRVPLPEDPERRDAIVALQRELADIDVALTAGRIESAQARLTEAHARAVELEWPALQAKALRMEFEANDADPKAQEELSRRAILAASQAGDASAVALGWTQLLFAVGIRGGRVEEARGLEVGLDAAVARLGERDPAHFEALATKGALANAAGDYAAAATLLRAAIVAADDVLGEYDPRTSALRNNLGTVLLFEGKTDEALVQFETALEMVNVSLGPKHPRAAENQMNIGIVYIEDGEGEKAVAPLRSSIALLSEDAELNARRIAIARSNLAFALVETLALEEAGEQAALSLKELEAIYPEGHPNLAAPIHALGMLAALRGDVEGSRTQFERSLKILDDAVGPEHPNRAQAFISLAELRIDVGEAAAVIDDLQRARERVVEARGADNRLSRSSRLTIADANLELGRDPGLTVAEAERLAEAYPGYAQARGRFIVARIQAHAGDVAAARRTLAAIDPEALAADALVRGRIERLRGALAP